jgi:DNA-directed RNA polymerase subunit RPC12/RpoP
MNVHCFHLSSFAAGASRMQFRCARCGSETALTVDQLADQYGTDCSLAEILAEASCRECGCAYIIASPDWAEE